MLEHLRQKVRHRHCCEMVDAGMEGEQRKEARVLLEEGRCRGGGQPSVEY